MISARPTENFTGIIVEGDFEDFYEIVESIYRMTGLEDSYSDPYWSVKNRLLSICYDIRHAYQGDRKVKLVDNGANDELMKWHSMIIPGQNLHFAVEILFPEALFVAFATPELYISSSVYYGDRARKLKKKEDSWDISIHNYSDYIRDKAILDLLCGVILSAFSDVVGDEEFEKTIYLRKRQYSNNYMGYAAQYLDKCNIDYLKTPIEKRKDKLRNIARRLVKKPDAYFNMRRTLEAAAVEYGCSIHELHDPDLTYPDEIEW